MNVPERGVVREWGVQEVQEFLRQAGMEDCGAILEKKGVDGLALLGMNDAILQMWSREMKIIQIKKLSKLVTKLNCSPQSSGMALPAPPSLSFPQLPPSHPTNPAQTSHSSKPMKGERKASLHKPDNTVVSKDQNTKKSDKSLLKPQLSPKPTAKMRKENLPYRTTLNRPQLKPITPGFVKHIGKEETKSSQKLSNPKEPNLNKSNPVKPSSPKSQSIPNQVSTTETNPFPKSIQPSTSKQQSPKPLHKKLPFMKPPISSLQSPKSGSPPLNSRPPCARKATTPKPLVDGPLTSKSVIGPSHISKNLSPKSFATTKAAEPKSESQKKFPSDAKLSVIGSQQKPASLIHSDISNPLSPRSLVSKFSKPVNVVKLQETHVKVTADIGNRELGNMSSPNKTNGLLNTSDCSTNGEEGKENPEKQKPGFVKPLQGSRKSPLVAAP